MKTDDHKLLMWLDQEVDGQLEEFERAELAEHLTADSRLAEERRVLRVLREALESQRVEVAAGFADQVMEALPETAESRRRAWYLPMAAMLVCALGAVFFLGQVAPFESGLAGALVDFAASAVATGAGLSVAAWRGAGMGLERLFADSAMTMVVFGFGILCLNLLFWRMLRRRPKAVNLEATGRDRRP